jgi:hypothetical protein
MDYHNSPQSLDEFLDDLAENLRNNPTVYGDCSTDEDLQGSDHQVAQEVPQEVLQPFAPLATCDNTQVS